MAKLHIDFETRSAADLPKVGVYNYATHPSTDVWMACWCLDDGRIQTWFPGECDPDLMMALDDPDVEVCGHNVNFEWHMIEYICAPRYGWPKVPVERLDCTAARAAAMALPRSLEGAGSELGLAIQKDLKGRRLMLQMAKPRRIEEDGTIVWWDQPEKLAKLEAYCRVDVEVERELDRLLRPLSADEQELWRLDFKINHTGVAVDLASVRRMKGAAMDLQREANNRFHRLTREAGGPPDRVRNPTQVAKFIKWLAYHGCETDSITRDRVLELLEDPHLPEVCREPLEIRRDFSRSSIAKVDAFMERTSDDGRMRENLLYHGATTGRWAGRGVQLQNLPSRNALSPDEVDEVFDLLALDPSAEHLYRHFDRPMEILSGCLRGLIAAAPGWRFIGADYSNIEGRVLAWLAEHHDLVGAFRSGEDIYVDMAAYVFGVAPEEVTKSMRFLGKTIILGCGYGMGPAKFRATCESYGIDLEVVLTDYEKAPFVFDPKDPHGAYPSVEAARDAMLTFAAEKVVRAYREKNAPIKALWYALDDAAVRAIKQPGAVTEVGPVKYLYREEAGIPMLMCRLPSGRKLFYPHARLETVEVPWGGTKDQVVYRTNVLNKNGANHWGWARTYGGKLAENVVQAIARDILAEAMKRLDKAGYSVVLSVHDEIVSEVRSTFGSLAEFEDLMNTLPEWAAGLPLATEGWVGERFRK